MPNQIIKFCVVVPCYNEEEAIPMLARQLMPALEEATDGLWRVLLVDDGSNDATARCIWEHNAKDSRIQGIRLSRNFGHQAALTAGLREAQGEVIGIIDCDLQDPVAVLMEMYRQVSEEGFDVCAGVRGKREGTPLWLRCAYGGFYRLMNLIAEHPFVIDSGDFSVFNNRVHQTLIALPEAAPVLRGLRTWVGFKQTTVSYQRPPRRHGSSKYNFVKLAALAVRNIVNFSTAPLRLATLVGLVTGLVALIAAVLFTVNRFVPSFRPFGYDINANAGTTTIVLYLSFIGSAILFCLGIMGEYMGVMIKEIKRRPVAVVAERTTEKNPTPAPQ